MKLRTVFVCGLVTVAAVGGIGYGAYYSMQSKKVPVEVVPVANVNTGYWGSTDSIYGTVTSQVSQIVMLDEEYPIEKIYVEPGDSVKEGSPLFSYDMTLPELELEMEQLSLQTQELTLARLEKDLTKLKNTNATASLETQDSLFTAASGEEELLVEPTPGETDVTGQTGEQQTNGSKADEGQDNGSGVSSDEGIRIDGIEAVDSVPLENQAESAVSEPGQAAELNAAESEEDDTQNTSEDLLSVESMVNAYEQLVTAIDELYRAHGEDIRSGDISSPIKEAVLYYRKHLADENIREEDADDGTVKEIREYIIRQNVQSELGEEKTAILQNFSQMLDNYQVLCVDMMIEEAQALSGEQLVAAMETIEEHYELLSTKMQEDLKNTELLESLRDRAEEITDSSENGGQGESETGATEAETSESGTETETETDESGTETETETGESGTETETETGESGTETETETGESETETGTGESEPETESGTGESETETSLAVAVTDFRTKAEVILMEGAQPSREDYLSAIDLYQQFLANPKADILSAEAGAKMEEYELSGEAAAYLNTLSETASQEVSDTYRQICFAYVRFMVTRMDPKALVRDDLTAAVEAYTALGLTWQSALEQQWQQEQRALAQGSQTTQAGSSELLQTTDPQNTATLPGAETPASEAAGTYPSLLDYLTAYDMILKIQELDLQQDKNELKADLQELKEAYLNLTETQRTLVWNQQTLIDLLKKYGLWNTETETEPQTEPGGGGGGYGDFDYSDGDYYTAEELQEMIKDKEREIKDCELEIRESEIAVRKQQRIVDGKVVKSTMEGTVITIGSEDGSSDNDYFVKVASEAGLFAKGAMSELALEKISVGDRISGMLTDSGMTFTAVIKEISEYPEADSSSGYYYSSENSNASYYPFYALIEDSEGLEEGEAEIQLSETMTNAMDAIYLELFFVRTDSDGSSYVYKQGSDGLLVKQTVTTGKTVSNYAVEITSGLEFTDKIAFPYGDDVFEGAKTKEVDMLEAAYM